MKTYCQNLSVGTEKVIEYTSSALQNRWRNTVRQLRQAAQGGLFLSGPPVYPLLNCWTGWGLLSQLGGLNELGGSLIPIQRAIQRATGCPCHAMFCSARMPQFCSSFKGGGCWGGSKSCRQGIATVELQAFTPPWSIVLLS